MKLNTKVTASYAGKPCGEYTVSLHASESGNLLRITPTEGTAGHWQWYLATLMGLGDYSSGPPSDVLALDFGMRWEVSGMINVYKEILDLIKVEE